MARIIMHPRVTAWMTWMVVVMAVALSALPSGTTAQIETPEQLLAEAISGCVRQTVTYVLRTNVTLTKALPYLANGARLTIEGACGSSGRCVIDGAGRFGIFNNYDTDATLTFKNLKLQNALGGAIVSKGNVTIQNSVLFRNKDGALVMLNGFGSWNIEDSSFVSNERYSGAAIWASGYGRGHVARTSFIHNRASTGYGGAINLERSADGMMHVFNSCRFVSNLAKRGGGAIYVTSGSSGVRPMRMHFLGTTFERNVAMAGDGGAVGLNAAMFAFFCGSTLANKGNRALGPGSKGNDLALIGNSPGLILLVSFCPDIPPYISAHIGPGRYDAALVRSCYLGESFGSICSPSES